MSKEINTKELDEELKRVLKMFDDVLEIYEQYEGEPNIKPGVPCPSCQRKSTNYVCNWLGNKHVHFICECGYRIHQ
ncbi:hypothetical protein ACIGLI_07355 [Bacillus subtilis]|uniref:hypothetical protein n=1 Tax=Bacillati TaxID=1783272 RepID=UPI0001CE395E|nr:MULTISPECIES: hypothetical protein [Bacillus]AMK71815.1 hypothetical protein AWV81_06640 [Bacillus subtilis subsp. natto]API41515.1 hypothetical protein BSR08_02845 [Bacillus subtilis]API95430.1 hypothetical protein BKP58_05690 [Bacillus subtilis]ARI87847.1 hypothetical protein B7470_18265 [Bacillus subtilis]AVL06221.1 hypothetical protein BS21228_18845 [Bacillus subtilis]